MSWDVMSGYIDSIHIYKVNNNIDLNKYKHCKIILGKVEYTYCTHEMDDWTRLRDNSYLEKTPDGIWLVSEKPIKELKEYEYKG